MRVHRARITAFLIAVALLSSAASCPPKSTDPAVVSAQNANAIVQRLAELQAAAIQANQTGGLTDPGAIAVVRFTTVATKVVQASPNGWIAGVQAAEAAMRTDLANVVPPPVIASLALVDQIIALVQAAADVPPGK